MQKVKYWWSHRTHINTEFIEKSLERVYCSSHISKQKADNLGFKQVIGKYPLKLSLSTSKLEIPNIIFIYFTPF